MHEISDFFLKMFRWGHIQERNNFVTPNLENGFFVLNFALYLCVMLK